jgi:flagellar basal-body rod modification protein FlgD
MSTNPITALSSTGATTPIDTKPAATPPADPLANQNVFLQLLVAQLKNQDPQNPADGTQFITQLAQFSELSNSTQMLADLGAIRTAVTTPPTPAS